MDGFLSGQTNWNPKQMFHELSSHYSTLSPSSRWSINYSYTVGGPIKHSVKS